MNYIEKLKAALDDAEDCIDSDSQVRLQDLLWQGRAELIALVEAARKVNLDNSGWSTLEDALDALEAKVYEA